MKITMDGKYQTRDGADGRISSCVEFNGDLIEKPEEIEVDDWVAVLSNGKVGADGLGLYGVVARIHIKRTVKAGEGLK